MDQGIDFRQRDLLVAEAGNHLVITGMAGEHGQGQKDDYGTNPGKQ
jgi:hypothetical protein